MRGHVLANAELIGTGVRVRRPENQATLHFFWLCVAFFGMLAFSFSGRLDRLDWVFYWGDVIATLMLPPLFVHFALVFPERPDSWARSEAGRTLIPLFYLPALLLGGAKVAAILGAGRQGEVFTNVITLVDSAEMVYLAVCLIGGLVIMTRALYRVRSVIARRQLRWIVWGTALGAVPFVFGYGLPFALGFKPLAGFELTAILLGLLPLAFASAIIRYRLMDVEVIIKRGLVYAAAERPASGHCAPGHAGRRAPGASGEECDSNRSGSRVLPGSLRLPSSARRIRP